MAISGTVPKFGDTYHVEGPVVRARPVFGNTSLTSARQQTSIQLVFLDLIERPTGSNTSSCRLWRLGKNA